ncbi:MAG: four helix bundle protein [Fimbriimonadaceae bacterium]|nr:four helix bundle protein [Fimbriimonadaceae bacterium]QYK55547.1 MAG: four helix bundle protein [Fimbriimonadaceae bacterium]
MSLVEAVYRVTATFPPAELYGLTVQMRRAAVSVPSNIAEGYGRQSQAAFSNHVRIARGSLYELRTLLEAARRLSTIDDEETDSLQAEMVLLSKKLDAFLKSLENVVVREETAAYNS